MDGDMWQAVGAISSVFLIGATALSGYWMNLRHKRKIAELRQGEAEDTRAELDELRDEMALRFAEMNERLDFTERLLTTGDRTEPERQHPTPA